MVACNRAITALAFLGHSLANVCSDVDGKTWQGTYSGSCLSGLAPQVSTDGPYCITAAHITSNGRDVQIKVDSVMPSTCEPVVSTGRSGSITQAPDFLRANYGSADFGDGGQVSVSLSTTNGTKSFGLTECSTTGFLQFNVSSVSMRRKEGNSYRIIEIMANYTGTLNKGTLTISRRYERGERPSFSDATDPSGANACVLNPQACQECDDSWTFYAPPPAPTIKGAVSIQSVNSGMCLDLPGGRTTNGNQLMTWPCLGNENQQWIFQAPSQDNRPRLIYAPTFNSSKPKCIDVMAGNTSNCQPLQIWDCANTDQQMWAFDDRAGLVYLLSSSTEKCFDLRDGGMKKATPVQVSDCAIANRGGLAIRWRQQWSLTSSTSSQDVVDMKMIV